MFAVFFLSARHRIAIGVLLNAIVIGVTRAIVALEQVVGPAEASRLRPPTRLIYDPLVLGIHLFLHVDVRLFGPLLPKLRIVDADLARVRRLEARLGERAALFAALDLYDGGALLQQDVDVFFAKLVRGRVVLHDGAVRALLQQVLDLFLGELKVVAALEKNKQTNKIEFIYVGAFFKMSKYQI